MIVAECLRGAARMRAEGRYDEAASLLGNAMTSARGAAKQEVAVQLEALCASSAYACCNYGLAPLRGDGVPADPDRGAVLLRSVADATDPAIAGFADNFLGHYHRGAFGTPADLAAAVRHFERAAGFGRGEAAFNAGLPLDRAEVAIERDAPRAARNYRVAVSHGSVSAMTNLGLMIVADEVSGEAFEAGVSLLETAAELGDEHAVAALLTLDEMGLDARDLAGGPSPGRGRRKRSSGRLG